MSLPRVLVTGGGGLVGSAVVRRLLDVGHPVTMISRSSPTAPEGVRVVRGDIRDPDVVTAALADVDAVAHLAGIPNAWDAAPEQVFANNAEATFTLLWRAADAGVRRFAVAGSVNATGLIMNPRRHLPDRFPVDERTIGEIADPYSLSKRVDELTAEAVAARFEATIVVLRLPLIVPPADAEGLLAYQAERPAQCAGDGWGWLDSRDAAEAFRLALTRPLRGCHTLQVAAKTVFSTTPTEELIRAFAPGVQRATAYPGRTAPIDTTLAERILGFVPRHDEPGQEDS